MERIFINQVFSIQWIIINDFFLISTFCTIFNQRNRTQSDTLKKGSVNHRVRHWGIIRFKSKLSDSLHYIYTTSV